MPAFFIDRPIFAWVVALFICLIGLISIPFLAIAQYPIIAPPSISISTSYPGSSPEELYNSTTRLIEEELNGASGILNFESTSDSLGQVEIIANFVPGTDSNLASVEVQNRIKRVEARLPRAVIQQGILVEEASSAVLQIITLKSTDGSLDEVGLGDFMIRNVLGEIRRIPGVGRATLYSTERSLRIWIDPVKLIGYNLTADDVTKAITAQNAQVASGSVGAEPSRKDQAISALVLVKGQLNSADEFGAIVLKANPDGSTVRLRDVARIEIGGMGYQFTTRQDGKAIAGLSVLLAPTGNALATASAVQAKMDELSKFFPSNITYDIPYNITPVVKASISKVVQTLIEAVILVFIVMFLFLQNFRYTLIPTIVVPIALLGTCTALYMFGYSINMLTMFGMVLAIGILVDDAIVVVENVERNIEEGLSPRDATYRAMNEVSGPIIAIALVLVAVFVPLGFISGLTGQFYKQFAMTIAISTVISAINSLTLSPALAALLLRGHDQPKDALSRGMDKVLGGFFRRFNNVFQKASDSYSGGVKQVISRKAAVMGVYLVLIGVTAVLFRVVPGGFVPLQDKQYLIGFAQLQEGATLDRTEEVMRRMSEIAMQQPGVESAVAFPGLSINGFTNSSSAGIVFSTLKPFGERKDPSLSANAIAAELNKKYTVIQDAFVAMLPPPPVDGLGTTGGFKLQLEDQVGLGYEALDEAKKAFLAKAMQAPELTGLFSSYKVDVPQLYADIDRTRARQLNVPITSIFETLQVYLGSYYVNDFNKFGRVYSVRVQADGKFRARPEDVGQLKVRSTTGEMIPLSVLLKLQSAAGPESAMRYNGFLAADINGNNAPGYSTGQAQAAVARIANETLPKGIGFEWTDLTYQEIIAGNTSLYIFPIVMLLVFLVLAAQYESLMLPLAIIMIVPMSLLAAMFGVWITGNDNNIFTQIGLFVLVGLSAKNAILIVEFARELEFAGRSPIAAAIEASRLRLRPILMTSIAFIMGVVPLVTSVGAGAEMRHAMGIAVFSGMIGVTAFGIFFTPVFYVLLRGLTGNKPLVQHGDSSIEPVPAAHTAPHALKDAAE